MGGVTSVSVNPQENWILPLPVEGEMTFPSLGSHQVEKRGLDGVVSCCLGRSWRDGHYVLRLAVAWPLVGSSQAILG